MTKLQIEIEIHPDDETPGVLCARPISRALSGCVIVVQPGENPMAVIETMISRYLDVLREHGQLEDALAELGVEPFTGPLDVDIVARWPAQLLAAPA